ncbi:MAG TPA: protein phosphatase, partial [Rugosimonospora sp.]|nr:protein phosphatase [Rugosimonospora sp.]
LAGPRPAVPTEEPEAEARAPRRRHPVRTTVVLVVLVGLLGGLVWGGWAYTQQQYYVGVDNDQVVIFRGIPGQVAGLHLSRVYARPDTPVNINQLKKAAQERVKQGISADSASDAEDKLRRLLDPSSGNLCDPSPQPVPSDVTSPELSPSAGGPTPSGSAVPSESPSPSPSVTASPTPTLPPC